MSERSVAVVPDEPLYEGCRVSVIQLAPDVYLPDPAGDGHDLVFWSIGEAMDGHRRRPIEHVRRRIDNGPSEVPFALAFATMLMHPWSPWGVLYSWPRNTIPCWPAGRMFVYWRGELYERDRRGVLTQCEDAQ